MTIAGQKRGAATRRRASRPISLRANARQAINELLAYLEKRAVTLDEANLREDLIYTELYIRNLVKARELLMEPRRTTSR